MRRAIAGVLLSSLLLLGCGGSQGGGALTITENGTYDVSGYDQVVVNVGEDAQVEATEDESAPADPQELELTTVQFRDFSMEVPAVMVEGYTDAELTENDYIDLEHNGSEYNVVSTLHISAIDTKGYSTLEDFSDAPQQEVNGHTMAIQHQHQNDQRIVEVDFIENDTLYSISLYYPVAWDDLYGDYAEHFYETIQLN